jgi:CrcB protein
MGRLTGRPMLYLYLALGGVLGTLARYGLGGWVHSWAGAGFPWGTLAINLLGSFLLGFSFRGAELYSLSPEMRGMITMGFCGAFTTFSTFTLETIALMQEGVWVRALLYAGGSVGLGLIALVGGLSVANLMLQPGG